MFDVDKWNKEVSDYIRKVGTWSVDIDGRTLKMEVDRYNNDFSVDGYVAWWDDDHGMMTVDETPYLTYINHV
jgi:hypothetical protein